MVGGDGSREVMCPCPFHHVSYLSTRYTIDSGCSVVCGCFFPCCLCCGCCFPSTLLLHFHPHLLLPRQHPPLLPFPPLPPRLLRPRNTLLQWLRCAPRRMSSCPPRRATSPLPPTKRASPVPARRNPCTLLPPEERGVIPGCMNLRRLLLLWRVLPYPTSWFSR